jgi:hypothetical protein
MLMNDCSKEKPVPEFENIQAEAECWDTHGFEEHWQHGKPATVVQG